MVKTNGNCTEGGAHQPIEINGKPIAAYICKNCGRVELYGVESLATYKAVELKAKQDAEAKVAREKRKIVLEERKKELKKIIADDNNTVKAVNSAKYELEKIEKELADLNSYSQPFGNY